MKLLVTALYDEAKPFIEVTRCKKVSGLGNLNYYANEEIGLLITGHGKVQAAIAVARFLQKKEAVQIVNVGVCGASDTSLPLGSVHVVNQVRDQATGRNYFPDRLYGAPFPESSLITVDDGQSQEGAEKNSLYDMEASGVYQAATQFVSADRVHFLKVISDHLEPETLSPKRVQELMKNVAPAVLDFVESLPEPDRTAPLGNEELEMIKQIQENWKLTETQFHQLRDAAIYFKLTQVEDGCGENLQKIASIFTPQNSSKSARNQAFTQLLDALGT